MTTQSVSTANTGVEARDPWLPMIVIALAQILLSFNISALPVSIGAIVDEFNTTPASVSTALVVYSLVVAGFVMLGAKLGRLLGSRLMFQVGVAVFGVAMGAMAFSTSDRAMIQVQGIAGLAAVIVVPSLVVLIASHYRGAQQAQALGYLGAAQASAGVLAFLIVGTLGTLAGWRIPFGLLVFLAIAILILSFRLRPVERQPGVGIDGVGAVLAAASVMLISFGFNSLNDWGLVLRRPGAPFDILGLSPAPLLIVLGIFLGQAFFTWSNMRQRLDMPTLIDLRVLDSVKERAATFALLIIGGLGPAVNFLIPLYIQIVQGRSGLQTAVAVIPYSLAIFVGTAFSVRLFDRVSSRWLGRIGFVVVAAGLTLLAFTVSNDWGTPAVIFSLLVLGLGEGALLTLVFTVLVSASPKELAGDVGALRGTVNNLSTAVGTAVAGALAIGILSLNITSSVQNNPAIPPALLQQVNLDNVNFVSNDQLDELLAQTTATPEQQAEAVRINEAARLRALKMSFLILAGVALLAVLPASGLPNYAPSEVPSEAAPQPEPKGRGKKTAPA
ncbi:MAG: MFS transporter [Chloroflexota bacterium]|nr:MAG: MFS transporter [Chloroflexota bacterium]